MYTNCYEDVWAICLYQAAGRFEYTVHMSKTLEQPGAASAAGSRYIIYAGVWFAVFNWGASFVAARFLLHPASTALVALSPSLLAALRFCLASLFFLVPLVRAIVSRQLSMRDVLLLLLLGQRVLESLRLRLISSGHVPQALDINPAAHLLRHVAAQGSLLNAVFGSRHR